MIARSWASISHRGNIRYRNEDSVLAAPPVFAVADGVGGAAAGDVASRLAIDCLAALAGSEQLKLTDALAAVERGNQAVVDYAQADPARAGMATTLAGLCIVHVGGDAHWLAFNVGDSRVYRLHAGRLERLTADHSQAEELVAAGVLSRAEADTDARRHVVTRTLGTDPGPVVDSWIFPPLPGERFIVCSDGLTAELDDTAIAGAAGDVGAPAALVHMLLQLALDAGGRDNISVVVVDGAPPDIEAAAVDTAPRETMQTQ